MEPNIKELYAAIAAISRFIELTESQRTDANNADEKEVKPNGH
jgi:hypothetical protein